LVSVSIFFPRLREVYIEIRKLDQKDRLVLPSHQVICSRTLSTILVWPSFIIWDSQFVHFGFLSCQCTRELKSAMSICYFNPTYLWLFGILVEQLEKSKQDDSLSDLSNILGELKNMAVDMGTEIDRWVLLNDISAAFVDLVQMFAYSLWSLPLGIFLL
jgi:hypothetical protein